MELRNSLLLACAAASGGAARWTPWSARGGQHVIAGSGAGSQAAFKCNLPPLVSPDADGLPSATDLFAGHAALMKQVERHAAIVRVPSISYDDGGDPYEDPRWDVFLDLHRVLREQFPLVHARMAVDTVNRLGLVYTLLGSDEAAKPLMLTAHQDVVPVADDSTWTHPPFSAYFDGTWLWGRGASDDKNSLTALLSSMEALLAQPDWTPRRTVVMAFGFDEESSGRLGAATIAQLLEDRWGKDSMVMILDEGGLGLQKMDDVLYCLPGVTEKGHINVWYELHVQGGHSSLPFPHTGIGIMAEIVATLEGHPYKPRLVKGSPVHNHFVCQARYSPDANPKITKLVKKGKLKALMEELVKVDRSMNFRLQTSQSVDMIQGGVKINAMPEVVTLGVNYRVALHNSLREVEKTTLKLIKPIVKKYSLTLKAFEGEDDMEEKAPEVRDGLWPLYDVDYNGTLVLSSIQRTFAAPVSPTTGSVWDLFSGTIQHTFAFDNGTVVPVGEMMNGNTDTRHYWGLTKNIYRWSPAREGESQNIHTINERINMRGHMEVVKFYYDLIRNFDAAEV